MQEVMPAARSVAEGRVRPESARQWARASSHPARLRTVLFATALSACAGPLLWAAWNEHGVFWPDEVLQTLEQGHRFAFGYGLVPWEFRDGLRSWLVPGAIGIVMKLGAMSGIHSGLGLARLVKVCFAMGTLSGGYATMRLAERFGGLLAAMFAGALFATSPLVVYFGSRCLTDAVSVPLVAFGALMLTSPRESPRLLSHRFAAGALLGIATVVRPQNALLAAAALAVLLAARAWPGARSFVVGGALAILVGGLLDWATWGAPFASTVAYLRYNLVEGKAADFGTEPAAYYARAVWTSTGWPVGVLAVGLLAAAPRARKIVVLLPAFVVVHVLVPHKELRFLLPIVPVVTAASAVGIVLLLGWFLPAQRATKAAIVSAVAIAVGATSLHELTTATFASMGYLRMDAIPAWHQDEQATLLFSRAGVRPDVCGVIFLRRNDSGWGHTGTYSYLHRDVPLFHASDAGHALHANYIVAPLGSRVPTSYDEIEVLDTHALYRRAGTCDPPAANYSREAEK